MSTTASKDAANIRLVFELARDDHPRLYDELIRFPKGTKRINRLRVLAYDGLLAQAGQWAVAGTTARTLGRPSDGSVVTNDLFAPSHTE